MHLLISMFLSFQSHALPADSALGQTVNLRPTLIQASSANIDDMVRFAVLPIENLVADTKTNKWTNFDPKDVAAHGIKDQCKGVWKGSRDMLDKYEFYAEYFCTLDGKKNGPYFSFEGGKLIQAGTFTDGLPTEQKYYTGLSGEKLPNIVAKLETKQDGSALYSIKEVKCQSARSAAVTFKNSQKKPTAHMTFTDDDTAVDLPLDEGIQDVLHPPGPKDVEVGSKKLDRLFHFDRIFMSNALKREAVLEQSKKVASSSAWIKATPADPGCKGSQWMTARESNQTGGYDVSYSCQKDGLLSGPYMKLRYDKQGNEIRRISAHYEDGILTDYSEIVPGGMRPLHTLKLVNQDYQGYVLYDDVDNECAMPHRTTISYKKDASGALVMQRTSQDGNGKIVHEPDVPVATVIQQLKNEEKHGEAQDKTTL